MTRSPLVTLTLLLWSGVAFAQDVPDSAYQRTEAMIPMRDGVRLYAAILAPRGVAGPLPVLLLRTPYEADGGWKGGFPGSYVRELAHDGYIFVFQDIRGRYKSEGQFAMNRPVRVPGDTARTDEATDSYDTIEWLTHNLPNNNGRVGTLGVSYPGWLTVMSTINPHPALKAASPQAPMTDTWLGDDFFHNGAFRLSYGLEYAYGMEISKGDAEFDLGTYDMYDWYLRQGPLSTITNNFIKGRIPSWAAFVAHPAYDEYWRRRGAQHALTAPTVPTLTVGGWWDQEDFWGPLAVYAKLEPRDSSHINRLVMGPWNHGGWAAPGGTMLGMIDFGTATSDYFRERIQAPFFAYYLKDRGPLPLAEATTFEAGSNTWRSFDSWPPKNTTTRNLYLQADGKLSFEQPSGVGAAFDSYLSDPAHPVPYRPRPIQPTYYSKGSDWYTWLVADQRFVHNRPDVLSWVTEPLTEDLTIAGDVIANLFASTSGTDADWVVKLIDVYPELVPERVRMSGYQLMVSSEIFRGRYRKSFEKPQPVSANVVLPWTVDLHQQNYAFLKGHRVMIQVQSTWFPIYDRNPQTFVPNIFLAKASDYRAATQRIYHSGRYPSHVTVSVLNR